MGLHWNTLPRPILALAPMAGVTDASYRQLIKKLEPSTLLYSEFLSTDAIAFGAKKTLSLLSFDPAIERPFIVQIFGADPHHFLQACRVIEQMGADGIDINMGCPAAKIVSSCYGSALIRTPDLAAKLVESAVKAVSIPVSVKTRLGWDTHETLIPFCKRLLDAGAAALAIHGRTYTDKFSGAANWEPIYALKREVNVPVIGNGDIASVSDALSKIGALDGVMVGRGTFGNPWLMADIAKALSRVRAGETKEAIIASMAEPVSPEERSERFRARVPFILEHCALAVAMKGERRGVLEMRRHLSSYIKGFDGARELRTRLLSVTTLSDIQRELS